MAYFGLEPLSASYLTDYLSGDNTTVAYTLSRAPVSASSVVVTISGVKQAASTYGVNGTTLTFSAAPPTGTNNIEVLHLGVQPDTVVLPSYRTITEFTATAGQTSFSPASYTPGYIDVFRNGVKLGTANFTATNGTTVVLNNACSAGDLVRFEAFLITSFNDAIPNTAGAVVSSNIANGVTINFADGSASTPSITNDGDNNTGIFFPAADTIAFAEGGVESMRLDSNGDVNLYTAKSYKAFNPANTRFGSFLTNNDGTVLSSFNGSGEPLLLTSPTGYITMNTNSSERMRIAADGAISAGNTGVTVGLGVWSNFGSRIIDFARYADDGAIVGFRRGTTLVGNISVTGSATSYVTSSDYRLKENIAPMTNALAVVGQLKPVTYTWKVDGSDGQGFIAHELAEVVPDAVTGQKDAVDAKGNPEYQGVDTSFLVATLTAAIQELKAELDSVKAEVTALKGTE